MSARLEPPHTVGGAIARRARRAPARPALIGADGASLSYAALAGAISAARWQLQDAGLRREDRIGTILPPGVAGARLLVSLACNVSVVPIDPALEQAQVERVRALRERRDAKAVTGALDQLQQAAGTSENLLPRILECVEAYVTVGEISNTLRRVWGEYRETSTV